MKSTIGDTPRVFVGTYAKYNNGSLDGEWVDLEDFGDKAEFLEECREIHKDEEDPEFLFADREGIPDELADESSVDAGTWEWLALDESEREILAAWWDNMGRNGDVSDDMKRAEEAYAGKWDSDEAFAENLAEEIGAIPDGLEWPCNCIDWERAARELMYDYFSVDGHYFLSM